MVMQGILLNGIKVGAIAVLLMAPGVNAVPQESDNAITNASFENVKDGKPVAWDTHKWYGKGRFEHADTSRTGSHSVMIESEEGADFSWESFIEVMPFARYRLSGWIKTENVEPTTGKGALINLHGTDFKTDALTGTNDWTQVDIEFNTGRHDALHVNCLFGGWGEATGRAWYDDLRLELLEAKKLKPRIDIDARETKTPVSEYIYGQFIEHLGRCIYGGIWAEMLQDRKFYYAIGAEHSPWQLLGNAEAVRMVNEASYVGEHTPVLKPGAGIVHGGLGLVGGKEYVGRVVLAGEPGAAPVDIILEWGTGGDQRTTITVDKISQSFTKTPLRFTVGGGTDNGRLSIVARGKGEVRVGTVSLMPGDNVEGMRADTLELLEQLDAPIYRWPGGNFVSGYDWKDGIGERDKRPPRKNPAWHGIEHNDFGLDEFMTFCRVLDTEPLIVVNSGLGKVEDAVEELQYANGAPDTPMGKLRAKNGHEAPYNVKWWGIGNEMYGGWQLGHMPLEDYVKKHNRYAETMRGEGPSIKLVAVGATGKWSETMLRECSDHMDLLSEHFYVGAKHGLMTHVAQIPDAVRNKARHHLRYHEVIDELEGKFIPIALDEWNYWYGPEVYGEIGVRYYLRDALGIAAGIHEMTRYPKVFFMANYAQTVNVIGAIKTSKTDAAFASTGLPLKLYRAHYGSIPVEVSEACAPLDVAAAWTEERKAITIGVVNPTRRAVDVPVSIKGAAPAGGGRCWTCAGDDPLLYNEPGKPPQVTIDESEIAEFRGSLSIKPISVQLFRFEVR